MLLLLIGLCLCVLLAGVVLLIVLSRRAARFGSLAGSRIYQDSPTRPGELLFASSLPLCGKPDYLIKTPEGIVPVEYKSRQSAPAVPYLSHVFQLIAYCLLVEEHYGSRPTHGILKYQDREFTIAYTAEYEQELRRIVAEMVHLKSTDDPLPFRRRYLCRDCRQELHLNSSSRV
jgi:CRISPR-associated exonuclease Cas4